ncbi:MAG: hypothetical protein V9E83_04475 [Baekduia sp.]
MARSLHVRLDDDSERSLGLLRSSGLTDSAAVRLALVEAGERRVQRSALAREAAALAADETDRAEMADVRELMDSLRPEDGSL